MIIIKNKLIVIGKVKSLSWFCTAAALTIQILTCFIANCQTSISKLGGYNRKQLYFCGRGRKLKLALHVSFGATYCTNISFVVFKANMLDFE